MEAKKEAGNQVMNNAILEENNKECTQSKMKEAWNNWEYKKEER